jgi:dipeptidase
MRKSIWASSLVLLLTVVYFGSTDLTACTNILVSKGASKDGSTSIAYSADSHTLYGELYHTPAALHLPGALLDVYDWDSGKYLGRIAQVRETCEVIGNINEYQVAIGETTFGGRDELANPDGKIDYGSLIYIALQRAKTAREAIRVMSELVEEYGYYSSGESFSISDKNEVWIMEMIGKGPGVKGSLWVARKIPEGYISAHANQARIRQFPLKDPQTCLYAKDVITFARDKGWFTGKDEEFSFADTYAPVNFGALRFCEARVWSIFNRAAASQKISPAWSMGDVKAEKMPLWVKPDRLLSVRDVMELMRDHYEGTPMDMTRDIGAGPYASPYRWRPMTWEVDGQPGFHERAISTQQTGFSFVTQSRSTLPDPIGGIIWFGVDDTFMTVYVPMYCGIRSVPQPFAVGNGSFNTFSWDSAFWVFNFVSNYAYSRYSDMIRDVQLVQRQLEGNFELMQPQIEKEALALYKESPERAREYLTRYSADRSQETLVKWRKLGENLIFKYLDGNPKDEKGNPTHPPYPKTWYRQIFQTSQDRYKIPQEKKE